MESEINALQQRIDGLETALAHQTHLLEQQAERERRRRIAFWVVTGSVLVLLVIFVPRCIALAQEMQAFVAESEAQMALMQQQTEAFYQQTGEKLEIAAQAMESLKNILAPLEELVNKFQRPW